MYQTAASLLCETRFLIFVVQDKKNIYLSFLCFYCFKSDFIVAVILLCFRKINYNTIGVDNYYYLVRC